MNKKLWMVMIAAVAALAVLVAACGDDDDDGGQPASPTAPVAPPTQPAAPPASPAPGDGNGADVIGQVIAAFEAQDLERIAELLVYQDVACAPPADGAGGPPACADGETEGTLVSVVALAQCEGFYAREGEVVLEPIGQGEVSVYGVYRTPAQYFPEGDYAVVFRHQPSASSGSALEVIVGEDGVMGINFGCGETPEQLVQVRGLTERIDTAP
ncbi:MAG TPA: hypothetical protein VNM91_10565 [Dehalococcoidia bacterium]|nr:hypothetical protein [Dehalococcoidia bacterium]